MTGAIARSWNAAMKGSASKALSAIEARIDGFDQRFGASEIVILARAEHHLDMIAESVDQRVNLDRQSAAGGRWLAPRIFFERRPLCW